MSETSDDFGVRHVVAPKQFIDLGSICNDQAREGFALLRIIDNGVYESVFVFVREGRSGAGGQEYDVLTAWRVRNAALQAAAAFAHPGPDGEDYKIRREMVREWVQEGHDEVDEENRQRTQMLARMIRAEDALRLMVEAFHKHERWCGHNIDAPGDAILHEALDAAAKVLSGAGGRH